MDIVIKSFSIKQSMSSSKTIYASIGAGLSIAFGGALYALISSFHGNSFLNKWLGASFFSLGLILIVFCKGQLFTGNVLMIFNLLKRNMSLTPMFRNWGYVYFGNFLGSLLFVGFIYIICHYLSFNHFLSLKLVSIAEYKINQSSLFLLFKAIACNILVCLAVYYSIIMKKWWSKIIAIVIFITLFVGLGFEHSIANMFFIPVGLAIEGKVNAQSAYGLLYNLLWVTLGNIIGGSIVSLMIFLRSEKAN